ncbi:MAG: pilus assembly protein [Pseudomonadota bacterium]|nr:pilus assembly protein [Pseudomonadota bacterium]
MSRLPPCQRPRQPQRRQRGVSLFIVIVFVLLSMLLALWASRSALFSEMVVGNDADYQRAFEAAQALLQDAELDIRGENAAGAACEPDASDINICRRATAAQIPLEAKEVGPLLADLSDQTTRCLDGLCAKRAGRQDFWNYTSAMTPADLQPGEVPLTSMTQAGVGARYGQYTGAGRGSYTQPANPLLQWTNTTPANQGGWYWIEVLPYDDSSKTSALIVPASGSPTQMLPLNVNPNVVYRITALAYGRRPNTMVVLQQTYAQQKLKN